MATIQKTLKSSGGDFSTVQEVCSFLYNNLSGSDSFDILCEPGESFGSETDENSIAGEFLDFNGNTVTFRTNPSNFSNPATIKGHIYLSGPGNSNSGLITFENLIMVVNPGILYTSRSWFIQVAKPSYANVSFKQINCELIIYSDSTQCFPGYGGDGIIENCTLLFSRNSTQTSNFVVIYFSNGPCAGEVKLRNSIILVNSLGNVSGGDIDFIIYGASTNDNNTFFNYKTLSPFITTLTSNIDDVVTEIPVITTSGFRIDTELSYGKVQIGNEIIGYQGVTPTSLTGCSRAIDSTTPESHLSGASVTEITPDFNFVAGIFNNNEIGNPNLSGGTIIATDTDTIATLLGKNVVLTSASTNCIDNANSTYTPIIDIIGTARPQGSESDRGAYEFVSNLYFLSGAGNWDDPSHYSLTSAGPSANKIPDQTTFVIFTDYSGVCTITGDASCSFIYDNSSTQDKYILVDGGLAFLSIYGNEEYTPLKDHIIQGTGTVNLYGSFEIERLTVDTIVVKSGSSISGYVGPGDEITLEENAPSLSVAGMNVNGIGYILGAWVNTYGESIETYRCEAYVLDATISMNVSTSGATLWSGAGNVNLQLNTGQTLYLISGTYDFIDVYGGSIANSGTINTLNIEEIAIPSYPLGYSCISASGRGIVNNLIISACSNPTTFNFNRMIISASMVIDGSSNLILSGDVHYYGTRENTNITNVSVQNSNAKFEFANNVLVLSEEIYTGANVINLSGNRYWVFGEFAVPHFSVGTYTGDLQTGPTTITISSGIATFSVAQTGIGQGAGDEILYGGNYCYLMDKVSGSNQTWSVVDVSGFSASNISATSVTSIKRCFNSLAEAVLYSPSLTGMGAKIGTNNFVENNKQVHIKCYDDKTNFGTAEDISQVFCQGTGDGISAGYNTSIVDGGDFIYSEYSDTDRVIYIKAPCNTTLHCNSCQRHTGVSNTGYRLNVSGTKDYAAFFDLVHVAIEGLDILGDSVIGLKFRGFSHGNPPGSINTSPWHHFPVKQCLVHNSGTKGIVFDHYNTGASNTAYDKPWKSYVLNCIVWGQSLYNVESHAFGMFALQSVFYGGQIGIWKYQPNAGFDSELDYCAISGHSVADISGMSPDDSYNYNRSQYPWILSGGDGVNNIQLTGTPTDTFISPLSGNFYLKDTSELYYAAIRINNNLLFDPDLDGATLPASGQPMSIGAFSNGLRTSATIIYETIGTNGRDYITISAWNAATSGLNLVLSNEIRVGVCYNDSPFVESNILILSGATTDIDHYRKLSVASGQGHSGNVNEGVNLDGRLVIKESYFQLDGLRIQGSNIYNTGTITVSGAIVTLSGGTFPTYFVRGDNIIIDVSGTPETKMIWTRDSNTQITLYTGYPGYVISATPKTDVAYELYHYAATVVYCPGSSSSKNITIKNCIIHDWTCVDKNGWDGDDEPHGNLYGINIIQNGGCKVFNNLIVNILKINADSDYGSMGGIIISNSVANNYVYNNTVLNIECTANFMKAAGGIGIYTDSSYTDVKNNISIVRHYVYEQSSIPNGTAEDYSFDFHGGGTSGSGYNCERGGGYLQTNFMPGDSPNNSISGADPFSVFVFPRHSSNYGNGFYGSAWQAKGINTLGVSVENYKHIDTQIYQVAPGESGKISFENMYVFEWVGGYEYIGTTSAGNVKLYEENGVSANDGTPTRTLSGTFSYNRNSSSFVLVSGNAELSAAIEMDASGLIKFKESYITTDWTSVPIQPSGGNYYKHSLYNLVSASDSHPSGGLITSGVNCIGSKHNNSFIYSISERVLSTSFDAHLKTGSACIGTGINLSATFTELNTDIVGLTRDAVWDIGAYKYIASTLRNLFKEIYYYRNITIGS